MVTADLVTISAEIQGRDFKSWYDPRTLCSLQGTRSNEIKSSTGDDTLVHLIAATQGDGQIYDSRQNIVSDDGPIFEPGQSIAPDDGSNPDAHQDVAPVGTPASESHRKQRGYKRSKRGCLNCKFRKVKCDEIAPTCTACQRLNMPCGEYGTTLSKTAYATQKQAFLEQVRRKNLSTGEVRTKRARKSQRPVAEQLAREEQIQMQIQLGLAAVDSMQDSNDVSALQSALQGPSFDHEETQENQYNQIYPYTDTVSVLPNELSSNLFEINPQAGAVTLEQLRQLQSATAGAADLGNVVEDGAEEVSAYPTTDQTVYDERHVLELDGKNEPYVPSLMAVPFLMNRAAQQGEDQRAHEEAVDVARNEEVH